MRNLKKKKISQKQYKVLVFILHHILENQIYYSIKTFHHCFYNKEFILFYIVLFFITSFQGFDNEKKTLTSKDNFINEYKDITEHFGSNPFAS